MQDTSLLQLNNVIRPLCPRDSHVMHYDLKGTAGLADTDSRIYSCYRCRYQGCTVRYSPYDGYFTVIGTPDLPEAVEEPGINLLQCLRHKTWLYRSTAENQGDRAVWRCGVEGCEYTRADYGPAWPPSVGQCKEGLEFSTGCVTSHSKRRTYEYTAPRTP
jgi:hypothetical protein